MTDDELETFLQELAEPRGIAGIATRAGKAKALVDVLVRVGVTAAGAQSWGKPEWAIVAAAAQIESPSNSTVQDVIVHLGNLEQIAARRVLESGALEMK
ncbi:MAG TPA: hypothetical protein VE152_09490 [Acidimicrobiales bacterium]|jgi:hypothetical protein|nr:hypothetical protein [Acidimicrobiales bacterium]